MKVYDSFENQESVNACYITAMEDPILQKADEQQKSILDCNYFKVDTKKMVCEL